MPHTTVLSSQNLVAPNVEVTFATLAPTFDRLNVYANLANATGVPITWRLYATTAGIRTLVWQLPGATYNTPLDIVSGGGTLLANQIETVAADTYDLTASLDYYVPAPVAVLAGVIGFDEIINDAPPEVNTSTLPLVYDFPIFFAGISGVHTHFQAELDLSALSLQGASVWKIYALVSDGISTIVAPIEFNTFNPTPGSFASLFFKVDHPGADGLFLTGTSVVNDPVLLAANPVSAGMSGFSDTVDGAGGGGGITQLTQDVLAGPGAGVQTATVASVTRSGVLIGSAVGNALVAGLSLWSISQPGAFTNVENFLGGAMPFNCDGAGFTTGLIECRFGGAGGTINLPPVGTNAGRILHIADATGGFGVATPLVIQPPLGVSVQGGVAGAALTITTANWAQKLVLDSTGTNWMIF